MMCQHCNSNEATNQFTVNFMGTEYEVHLCDECAGKMRQWASVMHRQMANGGAAYPWWQEAVKAAGSRAEPPFPYDAGEAVRARRRINQLKGRLSRAVAAEHYELAATLRDEIEALEREAPKAESALTNL